MISCDTNLFLHAYNKQSAFHIPAKIFFVKHALNRDFAICELVLIEFYILLRNPAVVEKPLNADKAVEVCMKYRHNINWIVIDYPGGLMKGIWEKAARSDFGRRSIFDARLALTLRHHGITEFATRNVRHFQEYGFKRVWDPLLEEIPPGG